MGKKVLILNEGMCLEAIENGISAIVWTGRSFLRRQRKRYIGCMSGFSDPSDVHKRRESFCVASRLNIQNVIRESHCYTLQCYVNARRPAA